MKKVKYKRIKVQCANCGHKTWRKERKFYGYAEMTCPKCQEYAALEPIK